MSNANELEQAMTDLEVLHGQPSADELAAVVVALTPTGGATEDDTDGGPPQTPAWAHAALLEAVGGAAARRPADLERHPS